MKNNEKVVIIPDRRKREPIPTEIVRKAAPGLLILGITTLVSTFLLVVSTLFVIKLAPIVKSVDSLSARVQAVEEDNTELKPVISKLVDDIGTVKSDVSNIKEDTSLIKSYLINR